MDWEKAESRVEETELEPKKVSVLRPLEWGLMIAGVVVLALGLLGEVVPFLHFILLLAVIPALVLTGILGLLTLVAALGLRPRRAGLLLLASLLMAAATAQSTRIVTGVPRWVRIQATPGIEAVIGQFGDGPYPLQERELPLEVREAVRATGCTYYVRDSQPESFRIQCSVAMMHDARYDHEDRLWSAWGGWM